MITVRQIQRLWDERRYDRLIVALLTARVESSPRLMARLSGSTAAAALMLIRLDEMNQCHHPIAASALRCVIASQGKDGGWDDPLLCSLCVRALLTARGQGLAIERGLMFLAAMQKSDGIWPAEPIRRLPADPFGSAFILMQLGGAEEFRRSIRFADAVVWFQRHGSSLDGETAKLWHYAALRSQAFAGHQVGREEAPALWS